VNYKLKMISKEMAVGKVQVLSRNSPGVQEQN